MKSIEITNLTPPEWKLNKDIVDLLNEQRTDESATDKECQEQEDQKEENKDDNTDLVLAASGHETASAEKIEHGEEPCPHDPLEQKEKDTKIENVAATSHAQEGGDPQLESPQGKEKDGNKNDPEETPRVGSQNPLTFLI